MAGLLDYITNPVGTVGAGLLGNIFDYYRNMPQPQADASGPQYDPMGSFTGFNVAPQAPASLPSVFSTGAPAFMPTPTLPQAPAQASAPAAPQLENPIAVGNYQMPRVGNPDQFIPQQAMTPTNAAPTQGRMSMDAQALPPALGGRPDGFFDRLNAGLQSIGNGGSIIGALTGNRTDPQSVGQQNLTAQFQALRQALVQTGLSPQEAHSKAMIAVLNSKAGEAIFSQAFGSKEPPKSVEEFAVRSAWEARNGMTPRGAAGDSGLPTSLADLEKYKVEQKAAEKRATTLAEKQAEAAASLPDTLARAQETIKQIDELKGHPAKGYRTGMGSILPAVPGFGGVDFDERVKQIKGGAFLDAYKMLRGTGAISEAEGAKAEQAQARLSQAKSQKDFDQALDDLRAVVVSGYERAQKMAGEQKVTPYQMPVGQSRNIGGVTIKRIN